MIPSSFSSQGNGKRGTRAFTSTIQELQLESTTQTGSQKTLAAASGHATESTPC